MKKIRMVIVLIAACTIVAGVTALRAQAGPVQPMQFIPPCEDYCPCTWCSADHNQAACTAMVCKLSPQNITNCRQYCGVQ